MINGKRVITIIPARGGSKGLPGKNIKHLCGKPLVSWPISAALNCPVVDTVIVSTEDAEIAGIAKKAGAKVPFMRPSHLAEDTSSTISVLTYTLQRLSEMGDEYDYCILLEPTSPLTENIDISLALDLLDSKRDIADSIVGVSEVVSAHPVFDSRINSGGLLEPFHGADFSSVGRRQEIEELYFFEGSLYISDVISLMEKKSFYHGRTLPYVVPKWKSLEIDDLVDFICVEAILKNIESIR